jgi:hypothetical protein
MSIFQHVRNAALEEQEKEEAHRVASHTKQVVRESEKNRLMKKKYRDEMRASVKREEEEDPVDEDEGLEYGSYEDGEEEEYEDDTPPPTKRARRGNGREGGGSSEYKTPSAAGLKRGNKANSMADSWQKIVGVNSMVPHLPQNKLGAYFNALRGDTIRNYGQVLRGLVDKGRKFLTPSEKKLLAQNKSLVNKMMSKDKVRMREAWGNKKKLTQTIVSVMNALEPVRKKGKRKTPAGRRRDWSEGWGEDEDDDDDDDDDEDEDEDYEDED